MGSVLPADLELPTVVDHDGILVVRDDLFDGGTKARVARFLLDSNDEWVFAGPAQGYAQLALAIACEQTGKRGVLFIPKRKQLAPITAAAVEHGITVVEVPAGRMSVLQARARAYCALTGATHVPLGLLLPGMEQALTELARRVAATLEPPPQVWVTAGSGTLSRALAAAFPDSEVHAVQVGMTPKVPERATLWHAPEAFHDDAAGQRPPFPSAVNYDAKAWRFVAEHAEPGSLFWNVAR